MIKNIQMVKIPTPDIKLMTLGEHADPKVDHRHDPRCLRWNEYKIDVTNPNVSSVFLSGCIHAGGGYMFHG